MYADWLDEQVNPHSQLLAEYIQVETELARMPQDDPRGSDLVGRLIDLCAQSQSPLGGWDYAADLDRIRQKMDTLRTADSTRAIFGAGVQGRYGHGYHLNPPLCETHLLRFEEQLSFLLPADYRAFLLKVGNGPMGPYYGLTPLDLGQNFESLRRPFPFTREQTERTNTDPDQGRLTFGEDGQREGGYLHLSEIGCGIYDMLVIKGESRGCVWTSNDVCELILTADGGQTRRAFLDWYEEWPTTV